MLKDGVHLNDHGNYLMAELVKRTSSTAPSWATRPGATWSGPSS